MNREHSGTSGKTEDYKHPTAFYSARSLGGPGAVAGVGGQAASRLSPG